jgi:hypothetical protein
LLTGAFDIHLNDGLYWRVANDNMGQSSSINLPVHSSSMVRSGPKHKLQNALSMLPKGISGMLTYSNHIIDRKVKVQLTRMITPLPFLKLWFGRSKSLIVESSAHVVDPVEFIRSTDLVLTYLPILKESMTDKEAAQTIHDTFPDPIETDLNIDSEAKASQYIQKLVHGHTVVMDTEDTGKSRKIDALDPDGIAHEAKYTVNNKQAHQEILKDVELIRKGKIKGAVWHFFRNKKTGQVGLSPSLRADLENHGIIVVVHN